MITKFNIFESVNEPFKAGDYAIIPIRINDNADLYIVEIIEILRDNHFYYKREGSKKPKSMSYFNHIKYWSTSKEELEVKLNEIKYNL